MKCEICGKTSAFGKKVARSRMYVDERTNRKIKPNLHGMKIETDCGIKRITACTRCIRSVKNGKIQSNAKKAIS